MEKRSANASILGYKFQLLKNIEEVLDSDDNIIICEGIEDIDVQSAHSNKLIQCKYHSSKSFSYSIIRDPIISFIKLFCDPSNRENKYILYAYFFDNSGPSEVNIDILKRILTFRPRNKEVRYVWKEMGLSDNDLIKFLEYFHYSSGVEISKLESIVIDKLSGVCGISRGEAEIYQLPLAFTMITSIASRSNIEARKVTKKELHNYLKEGKSKFITIAYEYYFGRKKYLSFLKELIRREGVLSKRSDTKMKLLLVSNNFVKDRGIVDSLEVIIESSLKSKEAGSVPWTIVLDGNKDEVRNIKTLFLQRKISFFDGHEEFNNDPSLFVKPPVRYFHDKSGRFKDSSFQLKVISLETYNKWKEDIGDLHIFMEILKSGEQSWLDRVGISSTCNLIIKVENLNELKETIS